MIIPVLCPMSPKSSIQRFSPNASSTPPKDINPFATPSSPKGIGPIAKPLSPKCNSPIAIPSLKDISPIAIPSLKDISPIAIPSSPKDIGLIAPQTSPEKMSQILNQFASPKVDEIRTENKRNEKTKLEDRSDNKKEIEEINIENNNKGISGTLHHLFVDYFSPKRSFNKCSREKATTPELPEGVDENTLMDKPTTSKVKQILKLPPDIEKSNTLPTGEVTQTTSKLEINASKLSAEIENGIEEKTSNLSAEIENEMEGKTSKLSAEIEDELEEKTFKLSTEIENDISDMIGVDTQTGETTFELEVSTSKLAAGLDESNARSVGLELSHFFTFFKGEVEAINKPHIFKSDNLPVNEVKQENSIKGNKEIIAELKMLREDMRKKRSMETSNYQIFNKRSKSME